MNKKPLDELFKYLEIKYIKRYEELNKEENYYKNEPDDVKAQLAFSNMMFDWVTSLQFQVIFEHSFYKHCVKQDLKEYEEEREDE